MRRTVIRLTLALFVVAAMGLPAAATARTHRADVRIAQRTTERAKIVDFSFRPKTLHVDRGTRVVWVNKGNVGHTTTASKGSWDSGTLSPGDTFARVFKKAGTFKYFCQIHPSMVGKVVVG